MEPFPVIISIVSRSYGQLDLPSHHWRYVWCLCKGSLDKTFCFIAALNKGNIDVGVNSAQKMKCEQQEYGIQTTLPLITDTSVKRAPRVGPAFQLYFLYFTLYKTDRTLRRAFSPLSPNSAQNQFSPNDIQNYHEQSLSELTK